MSLDSFHQLAAEAAKELFLQCCHSTRWAELMVAQRPFSSRESLNALGQRAWRSLTERDWLEAFEAHPQIGDVTTLKEKFSATKTLASGEQSGVEEADEATLAGLIRLNREYKEKFGFIFIVFASGKSAGEMLKILEERIRNSRETELGNAAREQWKITQLRMEKLL